MGRSHNPKFVLDEYKTEFEHAKADALFVQ
jgi:hypothetical protein